MKTLNLNGNQEGTCDMNCTCFIVLLASEILSADDRIMPTVHFKTRANNTRDTQNLTIP